ncbi:MAG TPA: AarF/ABC1/UbiB kinase family protein [Kofleriaceae bacterium]|nr:AarF/ABC1/UbiB kinase family protein [Kofleriaceae bacterium]
MSDDRKAAERRVGLARLWARAKQVLTTDPTGSDEDDHVVDEEAARVLAANAGRLKGGLAKVAQLAAYDPGATLGGKSGATAAARAVLGGLWDKAPAVSAGAIARVVEHDLGKSPQALFASWDPAPLASASLGQVHAATLHDGTDVVVKVQYPGVADALRADLDDEAFLRKLAGAEIGRTLDDDSLTALRDAVRGELDYEAEGAAQERFRAAWADHASLRIPRVVGELSSRRVLTMTRAKGKTIVETAASGTPDVRRQAQMAIYAYAWGSPLVHRLLNADPNPGNFLVDEQPDGHVHVWCLDFGCALELPEAVRDADRELWWALVDDDAFSAAERFRMGLAKSGLLKRTDMMATNAHREWEKTLAQPIVTHGDFHWSPAYASELADTTRRVLSAGGMGLPARMLLLWRQRLGVSAVLGMLDGKAPFRRVLVDLIGSGRRALR